MGTCDLSINHFCIVFLIWQVKLAFPKILCTEVCPFEVLWILTCFKELSLVFLLLYDVLPNIDDNQILQNFFMKGCHPKPEISASQSSVDLSWLVNTLKFNDFRHFHCLQSGRTLQQIFWSHWPNDWYHIPITPSTLTVQWINCN